MQFGIDGDNNANTYTTTTTKTNNNNTYFKYLFADLFINKSTRS